MNNKNTNAILLFYILSSFLLMTITSVVFSATSYAGNMPAHATNQLINCTPVAITCSATVTTTIAPDGSLWRLWTVKDSLYYDKSVDLGKSFDQVKRVDIPPEKISSRGENRPKIAIDKFNGIYLSWAQPLAKRFSANIRFTYSPNGQHFMPAQTVNTDGLDTGHSFNEMLVDDAGTVSLIWLDRRQAVYAKSRGDDYNGSAIYLAQGKVANNTIVFSNQKLVDTTCVCCRLSLTHNADNNLALAWRHIYANNIRDHALLTLDDKPFQSHRFSRDMWQINGCPHQGPSLSIDQRNRYHLVWFNQGDNGKGVFYTYSDNLGVDMSKKQVVGDNNKQASHPHIYAFDMRVDIVWLEFDGTLHQLWHKVSHDNGKTFQAASLLSTSLTKADRPFIIGKGNQRLVSWHITSNEHRIIPL